MARLGLDGFNGLDISAVPRINNAEPAALNMKPAFTFLPLTCSPFLFLLNPVNPVAWKSVRNFGDYKFNHFLPDQTTKVKCLGRTSC